MKLYSVSFSVTITEVGEAPEQLPPLADSIAANERSDSPIKQMAQLFDGLKERGIVGGLPTPYPFPGMMVGGEVISMRDSVKVAAGKFEELQEIVSKFHKVAESLSVESIR